MRKPTNRPLVVALVVGCLLLPILGPAPASGASWIDGGPAADLIARLWGSLTAIWGEGGCGIDGNGGCRDTQAVPTKTGRRLVTANAGCEYDPNGRCRSGPAVEREAGCIFDPDGRCHP